MIEIDVDEYGPGAAEEWDAFVDRSFSGTFLHSRRYLSHQGDRFDDRSLLLRARGDGRLLGVMPAAVSPGDPRTVASHPGLTYGGLLHDGRLAGTAARDALTAISAHLEAQGFHRLVYKPVPHVYHVRPAEDDLHALHWLGARLTRRDLSAALDLSDRAKPSEQRRRSLRRARDAGVEVTWEEAHLPAFHGFLTARLAERHGVAPVHALEELQDIFERCRATGDVVFAGALLGGELVAGTVVFRSRRVHHAQYIAASDHGTEAGALDAVFDEVLRSSAAAGARWLSFGSSSADAEGAVNAGLHRWKVSFGAGALALDHYELDLVSRNSA